MELPQRDRQDVFLPDGSFTEKVSSIRRTRAAVELRVGIVHAFDYRTRILPYWYADKRMAPCSVRTLADVLNAAGFEHIRVVLQQWTPHFRPSEAEIDGKPLDVLLVSAMQVHSEPSYNLIRDAHSMGSSRPLIIAGGPKAIYQPTDYFEIGPARGVGADCVVTGEAYVLLDLLDCVLDQCGSGETMRTAFDRARAAGALNSVPGLVYLSSDSAPDEPVAVNTGVQRLLRDLDELPLPDAGYRLLEPPHRGRKLRQKPLRANQVRRRTPIGSVVTTHGCKFNCSFCPIPAVNQRTWRHKSPVRLAAEIKHLYENFGISSFFSTDDNFFNDRETVVDLMSEMAATTCRGKPLSRSIGFFTEATVFDVQKNIDILPLCRDGGLRGIWFGLEDLTADLVNKGQTADKTTQLFAQMHELGIHPMAMVIHSDDQPLRTKDKELGGLVNQARFLFDNGAVSYQCTYLGPAVGTRDVESALQSGTIYESVGDCKVPEALLDGNYVIASKHPRPWEQQMNVLRAYATFYNPYNTLRALLGLRFTSVSANRLLFQAIGQIGLLMTAPKFARWAWRLKRGPISYWKSNPPARIPMIDSEAGRPMNWATGFALPEDRSDPTEVNHKWKAAGGRGARRVSLPVIQETSLL